MHAFLRPPVLPADRHAFGDPGQIQHGIGRVPGFWPRAFGGLPRVDWIAQELCMSPNYLSDLLRKETGLSAQGHIHQALVDKAKHALASSQESIGEIAFGLGFEQPQSFTRLFKKFTGVTPKTYRSNIH